MIAELAPAASALYSLPTIPHLRLRCTLRALAPAVLPPFQGSLLRGAFGHALRRAACAMGPAQPCASCRLRRACVYTRLFETFIEDEPPPFLRGLPTSPRPYVFEPGTGARSFATGEELPFDLLLFGRAADLEAYAVLAIERMAASGLGRARVPFALDRVEGLAPTPPPRLPGELTRAMLRFTTPTRIKVRDRLVGEVSFRTLAFAMLRRVLEVAHFHVPGAVLDWSFRPLLEQAGEVKIVTSDLRWVDWERYSNRQKSTMQMGGFMGSLELAGDLMPFVPLLRAAEVLHVGKGATFGLGQVAVLADRDHRARKGSIPEQKSCLTRSMPAPKCHFDTEVTAEKGNRVKSISCGENERPGNAVARPFPGLEKGGNGGRASKSQKTNDLQGPRSEQT